MCAVIGWSITSTTSREMLTCSGDWRSSSVWSEVHIHTHSSHLLCVTKSTDTIKAPHVLTQTYGLDTKNV